jgi:ferredoxin
VILRFVGTRHPPLELPPAAALAEALTTVNSPVMFGCRTGLCGTCVVRLAGGDPDPASADEAEVLELYAPDHADARLACQLRLRADADLWLP